MTDSQLVADFTSKSGTKIPKVPGLMNKEETLFIIKMMLDEIMELGATVAGPEEVKMNMINMINESKDINLEIEKMTEDELIAEQADAFVDVYYFMQNAACKKGINLSKIFQVVHKANMNKRFPDGMFHKREDGKIIKPLNWEEPNVTKEIINQFKNGNELI